MIYRTGGPEHLWRIGVVMSCHSLGSEDGWGSTGRGGTGTIDTHVYIRCIYI